VQELQECPTLSFTSWNSIRAFLIIYLITLKYHLDIEGRKTLAVFPFISLEKLGN
jgi:hypothetical protein